MKTTDIRTIGDAQRYCEGIINDFESGISTKEETITEFRKYTTRLMEIFWDNAKNKIADQIPKMEM